MHEDEDDECPYCSQGDPTGTRCYAVSNGPEALICTREPGHLGDHVACGCQGHHAIHSWTQNPDNAQPPWWDEIELFIRWDPWLCEITNQN